LGITELVFHGASVSNFCHSMESTIEPVTKARKDKINIIV